MSGSTGCPLLACFGIFAAWGVESAGAEFHHHWHQWRGPEADGVAPHGDPPLEWSEDKNVRWKVEIPGKGSATPIVWKDRVIVLTSIETDRKAEGAAPSREGGRRGGGGFGGGPVPENLHQFVVLCLDRDTGKTLWRHVAAEELPHEGLHSTNTYASGSPITDGESIFASFGSRGIYCLDMDGKQRWKRDLGDMQTRNGFGEGGSPALHGDTLVVNWDHEGQSFIAALDGRSGETRWQVDRDERTTWATPLIVTKGGRTQVITNGSSRVRSYDLGTGKLLWECGGQASNPIPSPVLHGDLVFCMTGYRGYAVFALPIDASGDITNSEKIAWQRSDAGPYVSSPVLYGDLLYFTKSRDAVLSIVEAKSGKPLLEQDRIPGLKTLYSSPVAAAGKLYFTDRDGRTVVLKHGAKLEVLATNEVGEGVDASMAIAGRQLFLRGQKHLYCIQAP